jgi:fructokinase
MSLKILSFGETLYDCLPAGEFLGGAPCNLAVHAGQCGATACLYSRVGRDERGERARRLLTERGVGDHWLQDDPVRPTGIVKVTLSEQGEPSYDIVADSAWDRIAPPDADGALRLQQARFAMLACGTLAQRSLQSREALRALRRLLPEVPVFYDVNLRAPYTSLEIVRSTLPGVTILKINEDEAVILAEMFQVAPHDPAALFARLQDEFALKVLLLTRGARGAVMVSADDVFESPGLPVKIASTVGAGDALAAVFLCGWLKKKAIPQVLALANQAGAWVASQPGATPPLPDAVRAALS